MNRHSVFGSRFESCCLRSVIGVERSIGRDKVGGSPRPGKEVINTFTI